MEVSPQQVENWKVCKDYVEEGQLQYKLKNGSKPAVCDQT